jgi:hypothetical protein
MIVAFVGTIDEDESALPITGNGKTCGMVGYSYLDYLQGREVWSNYWTDFSARIIGFQQMINDVKNKAILIKNPSHYAEGLGPYIPKEKDDKTKDLLLCVTEMRKILDAVGSSQEQVLFIDDFVEQIRKLDCTLYYDTQRFNSIHKRLRIHTNVILLPYKAHMDDSPCYLPTCMKPHKIFIYSHKPALDGPRKCFNSIITGKHYNTTEFCKDKLIVPKKATKEDY